MMTQDALYAVTERPLIIALVNNMSAAAIRPTEAQIRLILDAALPGMLRLDLFTLRAELPVGYRPAREIENRMPDGMIVTGMEPSGTRLEEEPFWPGFIRLLNWAHRSGLPTIWSCLAAHAAVLHLDRIGRHRRARKISGVFTCRRAEGAGCFAAGLPASWPTPHSRLNELRETELIAAGYPLISRSDEAGVDVFVKERTPFLFMQGHPEYSPESLLYEYRRDVRRYLEGASGSYPEIPCGYFDAVTERRLDKIREKARWAGLALTLSAVSSAIEAGRVIQDWQPHATTIYGNWIASWAGSERLALSDGANQARAG